VSVFLGPLDSHGRVPPRQQTRVAAFLSSAHGALARNLALALSVQLNSDWLAELNAQLYREMEIVSLLLRVTSWIPDPELLFMAPCWEAAWIIKPAPGIADQPQGLIIDLAALGHAIHAVVRPAALLPANARPQDAFVQALRRIEFESGRLIQAQILFLKNAELLPVRDAVSAAVENRHAQVRSLWRKMLQGVDVDDNEPAGQFLQDH
jgi:hypothetical protein